MQSLQPDPKAQYSSVYEALRRIVRTEGVLRPFRGLNITMMGAGPAHALYFACYERVKRKLSDVIQNGGNSHIANGTVTPPLGALPGTLFPLLSVQALCLEVRVVLGVCMF